MQAIGDIISYFFPYYFNCRAKKSTKIQLGENIWYFFPLCLYWKIYDIFSPCVFIFSPLGHAIIVLLSQTVYGGKICQIIFSRWTQSFFVTVSAYSNWGKIYDIFSPCVFIFPPCFFPLLAHAINCSTFTGGVLGENILSLCVNVFPLCQCFSPCVFIFSSLGHAIIVLLSQTVYWGKIWQEGNQILFFPLDTIFFCDSICVFQLGENIWYFFPRCLYFFPPRPCN